MTNKSDFKLSVIIPSYNYANFIEQTILSVINQSSAVHEIIVIDDGSKDDTKAVVQTLQDKFSEANIYYFYQDNKGVSAARNNGFNQSSGEYLLFLDADDKLLPGSLANIYKEIDKQPEVEMIFGGYQATSFSGKLRVRTPIKLAKSNLDNVVSLLNAKMVGLRPSTTILKRCVLEKIKFPANVHVDEDTIFFSHVMYHFKCISIPNVLVEMPRHSDSLRENYNRVIETGIHGVEELFASLPTNNEMRSLKKHVLTKRYLKIGRMACINKDYKIASQSYMNALKLIPSSVVNLKHLPRLIKSTVLSRFGREIKT